MAPHPLTYKKFQLCYYLDSGRETAAGKLLENNLPRHFELLISKGSKQNPLILPDVRNRDEVVLN